MPQPSLPPEELIKIKSINKNKSKKSSISNKTKSSKNAQTTKKSTPKRPKVTKKTLPEWWKRMSDAQREAYAKKRPKSRYAAFVRLAKKKKEKNKSFIESKSKHIVSAKQATEDARAALAAHPEDRRAVRDHLERLAENPKKITDLVEKQMTSDNLKDKVEPEELDNHIKEVESAYKKGNVKKFSKLLKKTAIMVGLGLAGAVLLGTGTLPYAIIVGNLIRESHYAYRQFGDMIDGGVSTIDALTKTAGGLMGRMATNPAVLASTIALRYNKKHVAETPQEKRDHSTYFDKLRKLNSDDGKEDKK